jgi:hypothetical protein
MPCDQVSKILELTWEVDLHLKIDDIYFSIFSAR